MHLGNAWTALLAWLSARAAGGTMVLRMEDLDPDRSKERFVRDIPADLAWLGLDWDEGPDLGGPYGPYRQSERREYYQRCIDRLALQGLLYPCYCTRAELRGNPGLRGNSGIPQENGVTENIPPHDEDADASPPHAGIARAPHAGETEPVYAGACLRLTESALAAYRDAGRAASLRVRVAGARIAFTDRICGPTSQNLSDACGDFVLRRADGVHAYQLAVVADDAAMRVCEVVRGADLLDSTARQIYLYRLFGWPEPTFAHVPLLVDPDGRRLSKRRGDVDLGLLRERGAAPEMIVGYLAYKAGLIDAPRNVAPAELIDGFSFGALPHGPVIVQDDWLQTRA